jgi:hypothetical protein
MEHPDLQVFPKGHPPSPYDCPVLIVKIGDGFLPKGLRLCEVGWLEKPGFPAGRVPGECIDALVAAHQNRVFSDGYRGIHTCTLCGKSQPQIRWRGRTVRLKGHGHYLVRKGSTVYMAPELLLHYIRSHRYRPPEEFVKATMVGRFLTEDDLEIKWRDPDS